MSIAGLIEQCESSGKLRRIVPLLNSVISWRELWVTASLASELFGDVEPERAWRYGKLAADFDLFVSNGLVTLSKGRRNEGFLKLLDPSEDGVWTLRSQAPRPGLRVFGCFARQDVFIATNIGLRKQLGPFGSPQFNAAIQCCKDEWRECFGDINPLQGKSGHDYIRENGLELSDFG
jgi:hypothetical protein